MHGQSNKGANESFQIVHVESLHSKSEVANKTFTHSVL